MTKDKMIREKWRKILLAMLMKRKHTKKQIIWCVCVCICVYLFAQFQFFRANLFRFYGICTCLCSFFFYPLLAAPLMLLSVIITWENWNSHILILCFDRITVSHSLFLKRFSSSYLLKKKKKKGKKLRSLKINNYE